jgi:photosystem II stability/assembly factor-like uncharacterized protein
MYPTISPDGTTLYYSYFYSVMMSTYTDTGWTAAVQAPYPINDAEGPATPDGPVAISFDGLTMFVASAREGGYGEKDIWQLQWDGSEWTNPQNCGSGVNTAGTENHPGVSPDMSRLYFSDFTGDRPGVDYGGVCLFYSDWTGSEWGSAELVPAPVNSDLPLCSAHHAANGLIYLGSEVSEGGRGEEDIWVTTQADWPDSTRRGNTSGSWENTGELEGAWYVYDLVEAGGAIYAATAPGARVFRSSDGGANWEVTDDLPGASRVYSLLAASDGSVWAGTYPEGAVFRSNDGQSWQQLPFIPDATAVRALLETSDGDILAGTCPDIRDDGISSGRAFRFQTGNTEWELLGSLPQVETGVYSLFEAEQGLLFAGARSYGDHFFVSNNDGISWDQVELPYDDEEVTITTTYFFHRSQDQRLWAGGWAHGPQGMLVWSDDNGLTWEAHDVIPNGPIIVARVFDMVEANDGTLLIGVHPGADHLVLCSTDGGISWESSGPLPGAWETLCLLKTSDGTIYAGTTPNGDVYRLISSPVGQEPPLPQSRLLLEVVSVSPSVCLIRFVVPQAGAVELIAYDTAGRQVATVFQGRRASGSHELRWRCVDDRGSPLPQGAYVLRLRAGDQQICAQTSVIQ